MPEPNTSTSNTSSGQQSQGDLTTTPPAHGANSTSQGDTSTPNVAELERKLAEVLKENADYRKKARDREVAQQAAEEQRLKEQGEFKALAEKHEKRANELEPISQSYAKLAEQINAQIEAEVKDWPAEVKNLVPGADVPAEQRLEQMTRLRPLLEKLQTTARGASPGNRPNPPQASPAATKQAQLEANRAAFTKQRGYSSI